MQPITLITGNAGKLREFQILLQGVPVVSRKIDLPELQGTTEYIATEKCKVAADIVGGPVLIDDTSLSFSAFGGLPGPYIKWFIDGMPLQDVVKMLTGFDDKRANAVCTLAYCDGPGHPVRIFEGIHQGHIVDPRGKGGFGWDAIFQPTDYNGLTYAETPTDVKLANSYRTRASELLKEYLRR